MIFEPITRVLARFENGTEGHIALILEDLLGHYYKSEIFFQEDQYAKSVTKLLSQVSIRFSRYWCDVRLQTSDCLTSSCYRSVI